MKKSQISNHFILIGSGPLKVEGRPKDPDECNAQYLRWFRNNEIVASINTLEIRDDIHG